MIRTTILAILPSAMAIWLVRSVQDGNKHSVVATCVAIGLLAYIATHKG